MTATVHSIAADPKAYRRSSILSLVTDHLPCPPDCIHQLNALLDSPVMDLSGVCNIIRDDRGLSAQLPRLAHFALFDVPQSRPPLSEIVVLIGAQRLRTLVSASSVMALGDALLPTRVTDDFWQHAFLTAMVSFQIAQRMDYPDPEQAYLGGLLHDAGRLPLLCEERKKSAMGAYSLPADWQDNPASEFELFGVDHREIGRWIGVSWNLSASLVDVMEHHHEPSQAIQNSQLAGIVGAADHFCRTLEGLANKQSIGDESPAFAEASAFLRACLHQLWEEDRLQLSKVLKRSSSSFESHGAWS